MQDSLVGPLRAVSVLDPAIDLSVSPVMVYAETRAEEVLSYHAGMYPRRAALRPLSVGEFGACDSMPSAPAKLVQAFRLACEEIENFSGPGCTLGPDRPHRMPDGRDRMVWSDDGLQRIADALGMAYILELGLVAYERAIQGNALSGSVSFTLPPSSAQGLALKLHRLAAQSRDNDGTISSERSAESSTATPAAS